MIEYADNLPNVVLHFEDLPNSIRSANEQMTGEALSASRSKFSDYDIRRFVDNLSNCQAGVVPYVLNSEALALNYRSLNAGTLQELMKRLGVNSVWDLVGSTQNLKQWSGFERTEAATSRAKNQLNELINYRNQIAHSFGSATPGPDVVRSYLEFERVLAGSLVDELSAHVTTLQTLQEPSFELQ